MGLKMQRPSLSLCAIIMALLSGNGAAAVTTAGPDGISACPASGKGAVIAGNASCYVFTPASAGADSSGANATVNNYALAPTDGGSGYLVVYLNGSNGSPAGAAVNANNNVYTVASGAGHHVLALSYTSDTAVGNLCSTDECFLPTRLSIVTGLYHPGAATELRTITRSEGIYSRLALALSYLAQNKPNENWGQFLQPQTDIELDPGNAVVWSKAIAAGHSQGGGHAALLSKLQPVKRLVVFSSPCDADSNGNPASWLTYDPASWVSNPAGITRALAAPTQFANDGHPDGGDEVCPNHVASLTAMGIPAQQITIAQTCSARLSTQYHSASVKCLENLPHWHPLFQLDR